MRANSPIFNDFAGRLGGAYARRTHGQHHLAALPAQPRQELSPDAEATRKTFSRVSKLWKVWKPVAQRTLIPSNPKISTYNDFLKLNYTSLHNLANYPDPVIIEYPTISRHPKPSCTLFQKQEINGILRIYQDNWAIQDTAPNDHVLIAITVTNGQNISVWRTEIPYPFWQIDINPAQVGNNYLAGYLIRYSSADKAYLAPRPFLSNMS